MDSARKGKIATLPAKIRDEVNRRLHDGGQAKEILARLNADKDVLRILDEKWHEQPITAQNLSEWRAGGYQDWLSRNERADHIKTLANYSLQLAQAAGGSITEGAAAIAGGRILELLEKSAEEESGRVELALLVESLTALRGKEIDQQRTKQRDVVLQQRGRALELEEKKFQRQTAEYMMKFYKDRRVKEIMDRKGDSEVKIQDLVGVMFGEKPG
jgi:hypothetical protein